MYQQVLVFLFSVAKISQTLASLECSNGEACNHANQFEIKVDINGNEIDLSWKFNHTITIYGFQTQIYKSDDSIIYQSPFLHQSERTMRIQQELDGQNKVCVSVFENRTKILDEKCENVEITDLKVIIGILAGIIFLIPCIIGISYVIYKDFKVNSLEYEKIGSKIDEGKSNEDKQPVVVTTETKQASKTDMKTKSCSVGNKENKAFVMDEDLKQQKDHDQITCTSESVTVNIDNKNEKPHNENRKFSENDSKSVPESSETEGEKVEEKNNGDDVAVDVTEEDVSGTSL